jgi:3-phytase
MAVDFSANYDFTNLPVLGTTARTNPSNPSQTTPGQNILLGGFSGLFFEGTAANGNLRFITNTDRGPNGEPTDLIPTVPGLERPFALPSFQPELVRFELNVATSAINITQRIKLTRPDGSALTGLPNIQAGAAGLAYTDEVPIDLFGNRLTNDPLGADLEGIVIAADGSFWLGDEYRPAIYHFDANGKLLERFIPSGSPTSASEFGIGALPAVYAQRRANRGFEAVALEGNKLYAFIQSAIDNPDSTGDTTSRASRNLRILEFDISSKTVTGEYLYLLDSISAAGNARTDKIGDAVSLGNGKFLVVERDDLSTASSNKLVYEIDLRAATNINRTANLGGIPTGRTIEQLSPAELTTANLRPVTKRLVVNAATVGYTGVEKLEGLALIDANTIALLNDNDFGVRAEAIPGNGTTPLNDTPVPVRLGLIHFDQASRLDAQNRPQVFSTVAANFTEGDVPAGNTTTFLNNQNNRVRGLKDSNDVIFCLGGNDYANGRSGDDTIRGGAGFDTLDGDKGNDNLFGDENDDVLNGGKGDDTLNGGTGNDTCNGGRGNDICNGDDGNDTLEGNSGDDILNGGAGNDTIFGGRGNDTLRGGAGDDILNGGRGADTFVIARNEGVDFITDFSDRKGDRIGLSGGLTFANLTFTQGTGGNSLISITGTTQFVAVVLGIQATSFNAGFFTTV